MKKIFTLAAGALLALTASAADTSGYKWSIDPADGSTVEKLETIKFSYSSEDYRSITCNIQSDIYVMKDDQKVSECTVVDSNNVFTVTLDTPQTEPGNYQLVIGAGAITAYTASWSAKDLYVAITLDYTIEDPSAYKWTVTPAPDTTVESLTKVDITYKIADYFNIYIEPADIEVYKNDEIFTNVTVNSVDGEDTRTLTFTLEDPATEPGTYTVAIATRGMVFYDEYYDFVLNLEPIYFTYTIEGQGGGGSTSDYKFTVNPADESTVEKIEQVILSYDPADYDEISTNTLEDINLMRNGQQFSACRVSEDAENHQYVINMLTPATEPGDYQLVIKAGAICFFSDGYNTFLDNPEDIVFSYTIKPNSTVPGYKFTADPASGSTVTQLDKVVFSYDPADYDEISTNTLEDINLMRNGQQFSACRVSEDAENHQYVINFVTPATEPGEYKLEIKAGAICFFSDDYNTFFDNPDEIVLSYTIEGEVKEEFKYTVTPASGSSVNSIDEIAFAYTGCAEASLAASSTPNITVTRDNEAVTGITWSVTNDETALTSTLKPQTPITTPGTYVITLPEYMLSYKETAESLATYVPVTLTYTVKEAAASVVYDLLPKSTKPTDGDVIDLSMDPFNVLFLNVDSGVNVAADGATVTIKNTDVEGGYNVTVPLLFSYNGRLWSSFDEPDEAGTYTITVPQGSFGDADWQNDPTTGHANPEIVITVTLKKNTSKSDLEPVSYTPADDTSDLSVITLTFDQEVQLTESARATLTDESADYREAAEITVEGKVVTLTFNPAPKAEGAYRLTVDSGSIADAEYISSEGFAGHTNGTITIDWTMSGIDAIMVAEDGCSYFNLQGQPVAAPVKGQILIRVKEGKATKIRF